MGFPMNIPGGLLGAKKAFAGGHFLFVLDGSEDAGYVRSVEGGVVKGHVVNETVGPDYTHFKHLGTVEIDPLTIEIGMALSRPIFDWIKGSWNRRFQRKNGAIVHTDFKFRSRLEQTFQDALVLETTFPTLDGSSHDPAYLTVKLHPERVKLLPGDGTEVRSVIPSQQKKWSPSRFRLAIDGIDCSSVNKIDSFSVTQEVKEFYVGSSRLPEAEPTSIKFGDLSLYTSLSDAGGFMKWYDDYVVRGANDLRQERQGAIEFLGPDSDDPLFTVVLKNVGIFAFSPEKSEANSDEIKRVKIQLYVESMDLEYGPGLA